MPMYDSRAVFADPILSNFSLGFSDQNYVAAEVMPAFDVDLPSGRYRVFDRSDWLSFPARREPGTEANEIRGRKWSEDVFSTKEYALQAAVDDSEVQVVNNANRNAAASLVAGISPQKDATNLVTRALKINYELQVAALVTNASNYGAGNKVTLAGATQWNTSTADPVKNIVDAMNAIYTGTLQYPNLMVIPWNVWLTLANHPALLNRWTPTNIQQATYDVVQAISLFTGFQGRILVTNAVYNSADNIDATPVMTSIWGKDVWIGKVDQENSGTNVQTFGKTFTFPYPDGGRQRTTRWREEKRTSEVVRVQWRYDFKLVNALAGYIIKAAIA
jgi:hypothetical protein